MLCFIEAIEATRLPACNCGLNSPLFKLFKQSSRRGSQFTGERKSACRDVVDLVGRRVLVADIEAIEAIEAISYLCITIPALM